jgi:hypothetical protein
VDARQHPRQGNDQILDAYAIDLPTAQALAAQYYQGGGSGTDHPPADMRVAAITNGYYNGSPCLGRIVVTRETCVKMVKQTCSATNPQFVRLLVMKMHSQCGIGYSEGRNGAYGFSGIDCAGGGHLTEGRFKE